MFSASDHASARKVLEGASVCGGPGSPAANKAAGATDVMPSCTVARTACNPAPIAAVSSGRAVVMTGTRNLSESIVVTAGMRAPPPIEATATRSPV